MVRSLKFLFLNQLNYIILIERKFLIMDTNQKSSLTRFLKFQLSVKQIAKVKGGEKTSEQPEYIIIVEEIFD